MNTSPRRAALSLSLQAYQRARLLDSALTAALSSAVIAALFFGPLLKSAGAQDANTGSATQPMSATPTTGSTPFGIVQSATDEAWVDVPAGLGETWAALVASLLQAGHVVDPELSYVDANGQVVLLGLWIAVLPRASFDEPITRVRIVFTGVGASSGTESVRLQASSLLGAVTGRLAEARAAAAPADAASFGVLPSSADSAPTIIENTIYVPYPETQIEYVPVYAPVYTPIYTSLSWKPWWWGSWGLGYGLSYWGKNFSVSWGGPGWFWDPWTCSPWGWGSSWGSWNAPFCGHTVCGPSWGGGCTSNGLVAYANFGSLAGDDLVVGGDLVVGDNLIVDSDDGSLTTRDGSLFATDLRGQYFRDDEPIRRDTDLRGKIVRDDDGVADALRRRAEPRSSSSRAITVSRSTPTAKPRAGTVVSLKPVSLPAPLGRIYGPGADSPRVAAGSTASGDMGSSTVSSSGRTTTTTTTTRSVPTSRLSSTSRFGSSSSRLGSEDRFSGSDSGSSSRAMPQSTPEPSSSRSTSSSFSSSSRSLPQPAPHVAPAPMPAPRATPVAAPVRAPAPAPVAAPAPAPRPSPPPAAPSPAASGSSSPRGPR
ncbi:MAG: hypothetical protein ACT4PU_13845 [Planctomycetota bacterium]